MGKIWFIEVKGKQEGPYSIAELKRHPHFTLDTLVWREGFREWIPARNVPELRELFSKKPKVDEEEVKPVATEGEGELAVEMRYDIPPWFWVALLGILLSYVVYKAFFEQ